MATHDMEHNKIKELETFNFQAFLRDEEEIGIIESKGRLMQCWKNRE